MVLTLKSTRQKYLTGYGPIPIKNQAKEQPLATSLLPKAALMIESSPQNELYVPPDISFAQPKRNSLPEVKTNYSNFRALSSNKFEFAAFLGNLIG